MGIPKARSLMWLCYNFFMLNSLISSRLRRSARVRILHLHFFSHFTLTRSHCRPPPPSLPSMPPLSLCLSLFPAMSLRIYSLFGFCFIESLCCWWFDSVDSRRDWRLTQAIRVPQYFLLSINHLHSNVVWSRNVHPTILLPRVRQLVSTVPISILKQHLSIDCRSHVYCWRCAHVVWLLQLSTATLPRLPVIVCQSII